MTGDKGYYVRLFMRILKAPAEVAGVIEERIRESIEAAPECGRTTHRLSIPQILFRDMQLGVLLLGRRDDVWEVKVDGQVKTGASKKGRKSDEFNARLPTPRISRRDGRHVLVWGIFTETKNRVAVMIRSGLPTQTLNSLQPLCREPWSFDAEIHVDELGLTRATD